MNKFLYVLLGATYLILIPVIVLIIDYIIEIYRKKRNDEDFKEFTLFEIFIYFVILILSIIFILSNIDAYMPEGLIRKATITLIGPVVSMSSIYLSSSIKSYIQQYL